MQGGADFFYKEAEVARGADFLCAEGRERDFLKLNKMTGFGKRCGAMLLAAGATLLIGTARAAGDSTARVRFDYDVRLGTFIDNGEYNSDYKAPKTLSGV